ncbi:MAG TPA: HPr family phosphocarrier protein [Candidatus Methylomirabilis sp.]|nr:HPr family phosphocarrier protein [Candidatus Methylomirabilis sp.]
MQCQKIVIINKLGLHARASAKLVSLASEFSAEITLKRNGQQVNAKSIMGIMMLAAAKGAELELCAEGPDEKNAIEALTELVGNRFGEGE